MFRHHTPNPQSGAAQPIQDEDHTSHEQSTRVSFGTPPEKGQEHLTITTIRAGDKHLPPLNDPRCTKRSRWRQPPRETSESCSETQSPSAFRCNHSRNALGFTSNLIKDDESMMEISVRALDKLTRLLCQCKRPRE
jgi:hypothetical protein